VSLWVRVGVGTRYVCLPVPCSLYSLRFILLSIIHLLCCDWMHLAITRWRGYGCSFFGEFCFLALSMQSSLLRFDLTRRGGSAPVPPRSHPRRLSPSRAPACCLLRECVPPARSGALPGVCRLGVCPRSLPRFRQRLCPRPLAWFWPSRAS
jgi:hypothetical protein